MTLIRARGRGLERGRQAHDLIKTAVDSESDARVLLVRLNMNITRLAADSLDKKFIDEPDDGLLALGVFLYLEIRVTLGRCPDLDKARAGVRIVILERIDHFIQSASRRIVRALDQIADRRLGRKINVHIHIGDEPDVIDSGYVRGIGDRYGKTIALNAERKQSVFLTKVRGDELHQLGGNRYSLERDGGESVLFAEERRENFVVDVLELNQRTEQTRLVLILVLNCFLQLFRGDETLAQKKLANFSCRCTRHGFAFYSAGTKHWTDLRSTPTMGNENVRKDNTDIIIAQPGPWIGELFSDSSRPLRFIGVTAR